jgi:hypothetical protein
MAQRVGAEEDIERRCTRRAALHVRVWRIVAGQPLGLFTYAGEADSAVLHAVLQHVRRLTAAVPGDWCIEVIVAGFEGALLQTLEASLGALRRNGLRARLSQVPRLRPEVRALLAQATVATAAIDSLTQRH